MSQFHFPRCGCLVLPWDLSVVQLVHHRELPKKREIMRSLKDPFTQRRNMKSSRELFRTKEMLLNVLTQVYWLSTLNRFAYLCISFTNLYNCAILPFIRFYASGKKEDTCTTCPVLLSASVYFLYSVFCVFWHFHCMFSATGHFCPNIVVPRQAGTHKKAEAADSASK